MRIQLQDIRAEVTFRRNTVRLTLRHMGNDDFVRVSAPCGCSEAMLRAFLIRHQDWIRERLAKAAELRKTGLTENAVSGEMTWAGFRVKVTVRANARHMSLTHHPHEAFFSLSVPVSSSRADVQRVLQSNTAWMQRIMAADPLPDWTPTYAAGERHWVLGQLVTLGRSGVPCGEKAFRHYRREQLLALLHQQTDRWQQTMGVRAESIAVRDMRSRWGSCTVRTGALRFSEKLGYYPPEIVAETVVHELTHLRHANHSKAFYDEMTRWYPEWKRMAEWRGKFDINPRQPE